MLSTRRICQSSAIRGPGRAGPRCGGEGGPVMSMTNGHIMNNKSKKKRSSEIFWDRGSTISKGAHKFQYGPINFNRGLEISTGAQKFRDPGPSFYTLTTDFTVERPYEFPEFRLQKFRNFRTWKKPEFPEFGNSGIAITNCDDLLLEIKKEVQPFRYVSNYNFVFIKSEVFEGVRKVYYYYFMLEKCIIIILVRKQ